MSEDGSCPVRKGVSMNGAKVAGIEAAFGFGGEPVLIRLECYRRRPRKKLASKRIPRGDGYFRRGLVIQGHVSVLEDNGISGYRADLFEHWLAASPCDIASLDASIDNGVGDFREVDENDIANCQRFVLRKRGYPIDMSRQGT